MSTCQPFMLELGGRLPVGASFLQWQDGTVGGYHASDYFLGSLFLGIRPGWATPVFSVR